MMAQGDRRVLQGLISAFAVGLAGLAFLSAPPEAASSPCLDACEARYQRCKALQRIDTTVRGLPRVHCPSEKLRCEVECGKRDMHKRLPLKRPFRPD